jgi:hypothetical protein
MAESKGKIEEKDTTAPASVESTTEATPHAADESSAPGPYDGLDVNRPPVSTNRPDVPIAQSLVAGAGAPQPTEGPNPEDYVAPNAYVTAADKDNIDPQFVDKKSDSK